jgi:hypothetical protein
MVSIINGALALSILLNAVSTQALNAFSRSSSPRESRLSVNGAPDETFRLFDTYEAGIDAKETRERLHWVAVFLKENPNFNVFIVSYSGQRACAGEAIKRAKIARQFLISNQRVKSKQLKIIDAGYRSNWAIEFWYGSMKAKGQPPSRNAIDRSVVKITKECSDLIPLR